MKIILLKIKNFRGLTDIEFEIKTHASVIVGPNAVGKTSILEAIRLVKCLLIPSLGAEGQQVLFSLGVNSPQAPNIYDFNAILGDPFQSLDIKIGFELTSEEMNLLKQNIGSIANLHVRNSLGADPTGTPLNFIQYFSSEEGQKKLQEAVETIGKRLEDISKSKIIYLNLNLHPGLGVFKGTDVVNQELLTILVRLQPNDKGFINYFPADRAMPTGEVGLQIGSQYLQQQMNSFLGAPSSKYQLLKAYIVNQYLMGKQTQEELKEDFKLIFEKLLPGKALSDLRISRNGTLSVQISESAIGKTYDIDSMSSGEKGLVLTFLLLRRACVTGGIVLIDEPELHLNPAVTKKVLPFLLDEITKGADLQVIICTHSQEILEIAYLRDDCTLFRLRNGTQIFPILPQDKDQVYETLRVLGASTSDVLSMRGCIFVEGKNDAELLDHGFSQRVTGFKITKLGGRKEVEKEIQSLQKPEREKELDSPQFFIFDLDNEKTTLKSSSLVKVSQWDRYCFENYLLDSDVIFDLCSELNCKNAPENRATLKQNMKTLGMSQLKSEVIRDQFKLLKIETLSLYANEIDDQISFEPVIEILKKRIQFTQGQISSLKPEEWGKEFLKKCIEREGVLKEDWEMNWETRCDGKKLISDIYHKLQPNLSLIDFKKRILGLMAITKTERWRLVDSILGELITI